MEPESKNLKLDADRIAPNLYLGSYPKKYEMGGLKAMGFDTLVLCAEELQAPTRFNDLKVYRIPMDDIEDVEAIPFGPLIQTAKKISDDLAEGKNVLVTCAMGINRSAMTLGLALRMRYPELTGDQAVALIRKGRFPTLLNETFEEVVRRMKL